MTNTQTQPVFHDFPHHKTMSVMDGRRRLCVARHNTAQRAWLLKADGFCWTDPRARTPNVFGTVAPEYMLIASKREARAVLKGVVKNGRSE